VSVAPAYRRLGLARRLMKEVEAASAALYRGYFVDLFVRTSNAAALAMYQRLGYAVFRRILGYYGGEAGAEDAFDMRVACARNAGRRIDCMTPLPRPVRSHELWPTDGSDAKRAGAAE